MAVGMAAVAPEPGQTAAVVVKVPIAGLRIAGVYVPWSTVIIMFILFIITIIIISILLIEYNIWRNKRLIKYILKGKSAEPSGRAS